MKEWKKNPKGISKDGGNSELKSILNAKSQVLTDNVFIARYFCINASKN